MFEGPTVLDDSRALAPMPYGGFNLENQQASAGWIGSVVGLAHFLASFSHPKGSAVLDANSLETMFAPPQTGVQSGGVYYACGWFVRNAPHSPVAWHAGSLAGTTALIVERWDGIGWAALFNQSEDERDPAGSTYADIGWMLQEASQAVLEWPEYDQFEQVDPS